MDRYSARAMDLPHYALALAIHPQAVLAARTLTQAALEEWRLDDLIADACLITSELVTNALAAAGEVTLLLVCERDGQVSVSVWDDAPGLPTERQARDEDIGGRGLLIVRTLSDEWGTRCIGGRATKVVWATLGPQPKELS